MIDHRPWIVSSPKKTPSEGEPRQGRATTQVRQAIDLTGGWIDGTTSLGQSQKPIEPSTDTKLALSVAKGWIVQAKR